MTSPGHVMILASAGSGKTYALTDRFVSLLALGAKPERIVALTFTRKAAGEFFDEILKKLANAASDGAYAAKLAGDIGRPGLSQNDFLGMLRSVAEAMPRLQLGTLDGFFARIASNFPFELGLAGRFEILEEHAAKVERARVLRRLFSRTGDLETAQREFIEAFKRATFGAEEKRLGAQLDAFIDEHQEIFLAAPVGDLWGNAQRIWPQGVVWLEAAAQHTEAARALERAVAGLAMNDKQRDRWTLFFADLAEWSPGAEPGKGMTYLLKNALKAWPDLSEIMVERKKFTLPPGVADALRACVAGVIGSEFVRHLEMTRGIHAVLAGYDALYHESVRRAGKLTFADVQRLLQPDSGMSRTLSSDAVGEDRLFIDYRLDGETDHWLLDEFQDTSFGQWSILRSLIDEAVQDPTGARTFFYVGDVKQAIFAWREGDPRLFREIFDHYNQARPGCIAEKHLVQSWRSGPPIISIVNRVFGDPAALAGLFPGEASESWNREWRAHESARPALGGQVAWLQANEEEDRFSTTLALLAEIEPLERGLSCAVLVRKNDTANRLADFLRREGGIAAVAESDLHVCVDNPLGQALLALAQAAAHPGDTLAWEHVRMTPLGEVLRAQGMDSPERLTGNLLGEVHAKGFERWAARWIGLIEPSLAPDDRFSRERGRQFIEAAGLFDGTGSRDVAEFVRFMEDHAVRENEAAGSVRVMTIHKSKGLGFDVVLLPDLEGNRLDLRRDGLAVKKAADRSVEWVVSLPAKDFVEADPVVSAYVREAEAAACYEAFSLLYVAMTRAKRAMYLVTKAPGNSTSRNFPRLLAETLGDSSLNVRVGRREFHGFHQEGDPDWFCDLAAPQPPSGILEIKPIEATEDERRRRYAAQKASAGKRGELGGAQLFNLDSGKAAEFGTRVHRLLAEVDWVEAGVVEHWADTWRGRGEPEVIVDEAISCLKAGALSGVWKGGEARTVWRERAFEVVLDERWVTGVFDRVVIQYDKIGHTTEATVYDFKTDYLSSPEDAVSAAERYRHQMTFYRRVVARLAGLAEEKVRAEVIFTALRTSMPVENQ